MVDYRTGDDTAVAGADYAATTASVTFGPGESSKLVSVPILNDTLAEGSESFSVQLLSVTGGTVGFPRTTRVVIEDDESPSGVALPDPSSLNTTPGIPVVSGLVEPTAFAWVPGQPNTIVVAEKSGLIRVARDGVLRDAPLLDLRASVNDVRDRGLLDIELHPQFAANPYLYAYYAVDPPETANNPAGSYAGPDGLGNRYVQLVRYTVDTVDGQLKVRPDSAAILLGGAGRSLADISGGGTLLNEDNFSQPPSGIRPDGTNIDDFIAVDSITHAGGDMEFGPDGALYVSVGDGAYFGSADPRVLRTHDIGNLSGKLLRVDPLTGDGLADNPFFVAGQPDTNQSKVYQTGLRNSFRIAFDGDGDLFLGEVGWYSYEEINTGGPGASFGWPYYEGGQNGVNLPTPSFRDLPQAQAFYASGKPVAAPFLAFSHVESDPGFAIQAITLGDVYTGSLYPGVLRGDLFFASLTTGQIFSVDTNDPARKVNLLSTQDAAIVALEQGPDGAIYYADIAGGVIARLQIDAAPVPTSATMTVGDGPDTLVLQLQQEAYQGNALYTVSLDGAQVGGTLTALATRVSGQFDTLTVRADLAPGPHQLEVRFLNDAFGGPGNDRNLFVTGATYNGAAIGGAARELLSSGSVFVGFTEAGAAQPPASATTTIGAGPDTLLLQLQQEAYAGSAQYTISIDGGQIGGVQTAVATRASGLFDTLAVKADLAAGQHQVEVRFLNDAFGSPGNDRNLFVTGATYNGTAIGGAARDLYAQGPAYIGFTEAGVQPPASATTTIGAGPDALVLQLQQEAYQGSAQYTVSLDGNQVGGVQTAVATRASGLFDTLTVKADLVAGPHQVEVRFLNDAFGGPGNDRNLFVTGATYNGATIGGAARDLYAQGPAFVGFTEGAAPGTGGVTLGAGPDALVLRLQQDAYQGSAQYTVSLDGNQVGGVQTAVATRASGQFDTLTVRADLAPGPHQAEVRFLNDLFGGTPATDRNLFVAGASYNGDTIGLSARELLSQGPAFIGFNEAGAPPTSAATTVGAGPDALVLRLQQDAYQGNAQYTVSIDGAQIGGVLAATATRASGQFDTLTVRADLAPGAHRAEIRFLNDAYAGTPSTDRNLFVGSASYNGAAVAAAARELLSQGPASFAFNDIVLAAP